QTGAEASVNPGVFKSAYERALDTQRGVGRRYTRYFTDASRRNTATWEKNWALAVPRDKQGRYVVSQVATWLWRRMLGDGGKNFDTVARAQVHSLLATGRDFGQAATEARPVIASDPEAVYSTAQLTSNPRLAAFANDLAARPMDLGSSSVQLRR